MALQTVPNKMGWNINYYGSWIAGSPSTVAALDAVGESHAFIGRIFLEAGSGSKTISSAGGKIAWRSSTITLANAATNVRIGIQDVAASGLEDGTFDVYGDYTSAGAPTANVVNTKAMSTGTKTITHGDLIAVSIEMTAVGGVDIINISGHGVQAFGTTQQNYPYRTVDSGAGPTRSNTAPCGCVIEFDDATIGWLEPGFIFPGMQTQTTITYNQTSSPDEYGMFFRLPFTARIRSAWLSIGSIATTDNFDMILYSDAFGTPVAEQTVNIDPDYTGSTTGNAPYWVTFTGETLLANVWYGIACRPTTNNNITIIHHDMATGNSHFKRIMPFGSDFVFAGRTNQTGAFVETQTYHLPIGGILLDAFDDGVGSGTPSASVYIG